MKFTVRITALFTALFMSFTVSAAALDIPGIGTVTSSTVTQLADSAVLTQNTLMHNAAGLQAERYIELKADSQIKPVVFAGASVYGGTTTLDTAAERLISKGFDVAAGMNGDYFTVSTGVPQGAVITEGIIRNTDTGVSAIGFRNDGQAFISRMYWKIDLTYSGKTVSVDYINRPRNDTKLFLYTPDYGSTTVAKTQSTNVILQTGDDLRLGKTVTGTVTSVYSGTTPVELKAGQMCLSGESLDAISRISPLKAGDNVTISVSVSDTRYNGCDYVIGAYHPLIEGGLVVSGLDATRAPRTVFGVKADGTSVYYTVDGRQSGYSAGMGLNEVAERLKALGCVAAIELDGGGSTDMVARYPGDTTLTRLGKPSDGTPRKCSTFIMFVNNSDYTEVTRQFYIKPDTYTALPGGVVTVSGNMTAIDTNYHPTAVPSSLSWSSSDIQICVAAPGGVVTAVGAGTAKITATDTASGASGTADVVVPAEPDSIRIVDTATGKAVTEIVLNPEESLQLKAVGIVNGVEVPGGRFEWFTQDSGVASVDQTGLLTAGPYYGSITRLIVGMGNCLQSVFVTIGKAPTVLADFEATASSFAAASVGTGFNLENQKHNVKYGLFSGAFMYDFMIASEGASVVSYSCDFNMNDKPPYLSFWLKGDGSGNMLHASVTDAAGNQLELPIATLDFTDYRHIILPMTSISKLNGFKLIRTAASATDGVFYIDQMLTTYVNVSDTLAPVVGVSLSAKDGVMEIKASAVDYGAPLLRKDNITLSMDGMEIPFTYDNMTGQLSTSVTMPTEGYHRVTVTARDDFGNYSKATRELDQPTQAREGLTHIDITSHWSYKYVEMLDRKNIFQTPVSPNGNRYFKPDQYITRADVAIYMSRALKLDESMWESVNLPYLDLDEIPYEALGAVKALYGNGYMMGQSIEGRLVFGPNTALKRAEAFAVLGRAIPQGISVTANINYTDFDSIPTYAVSYIELLAGLGIVVSADGTDKVNANNPVTRAEFAKMLATMR